MFAHHWSCTVCRWIPGLALALLIAGYANADDQLAKPLFGHLRLPAAMPAEVHGFYSKGCFSGGMAIPIDGPNWQAMRLSRNRRWGHPRLIRTIEELSVKASRDGWHGLLVGDMSQPRGGPMLTGHRSHQLGLDADLWFMPMPQKRMSYAKRENTSAVSVLKSKSFYVDDARWTRAHTMLLYHAASFRDVERILVHPGVKKKLCDTVTGDRQWLNKIRPFWGHHYHFHLRLGCPPGSHNCQAQKSTGSEIGCGDTLNWWFETGLRPAKKPTTDKPAKPRPPMRLADMPQACGPIAAAPGRPEAQATIKVAGTYPDIVIPKGANATNSKPIEAASGGPAAVPAAAFSADAVPLPVFRPLAAIASSLTQPAAKQMPAQAPTLNRLSPANTPATADAAVPLVTAPIPRPER